MMRLKYVMVIPLKVIVAVISSRGLVYSSIGSSQLYGSIYFNSHDPIMGRRA